DYYCAIWHSSSSVVF
nr:immunoglobulin light chain junction region [Macaca mulatta]